MLQTGLEKGRVVAMVTDANAGPGHCFLYLAPGLH